MSETTLDGPRFSPDTAPRRLVVLLHGIGADGNDLISLAPVLAEVLPETAFVAPHAPFPFDMAPFGRQWFSLESVDPHDLLKGAESAHPYLEAFLDAELAAQNLSEKDLALIGFSQGTMMALHTALRRPKAPAAIVGFSGALIGPHRLAEEMRSRPPVLLVHGEDDPVVPFKAMEAAEQSLQALGVPVQAFGRPGLAHGIDETGLKLAVSHLREAFFGGGDSELA